MAGGLLSKAFFTLAIFCLVSMFLLLDKLKINIGLTRQKWETNLQHIIVTRDEVNQLNASTWDVQIKRKNSLKKFCKTHANITNQSKALKRPVIAYISVEHKIAYCEVPKIASTTWKRMFLLFDKKYEWNKVTELDKLNVHSQGMMRLVKRRMSSTLYKDFYLFFISRHPFERLASAYRNKLFDPYPGGSQQTIIRTHGKKILRMFRENITEAENTGHGVRFDEFIKYIIETRSFDKHWKPVTLLCPPCYFNYSYIAKMETLINDSKMILVNAGIKEKYMFLENSNDDRYQEKSSANVKKYFENISNSDVLKLYEVYKDDFDAYGYTIPDYLL